MDGRGLFLLRGYLIEFVFIKRHNPDVMLVVRSFGRDSVAGGHSIEQFEVSQNALRRSF